VPIRSYVLGFLLLPCLLAAQHQYKLPKSADPSQLIPNQIALKLKPSVNENGRSNRYYFPKLEGIITFSPLRKSSGSASRSSSSILDGMFIVEISEEENPLEMVNKLLTYDEVLYAEVMFREQLFQIPNDPFANPSTGSQGYLEVIKAYDAWDFTTGREDIVIGIVDTGMDLMHEDLVGNFYTNPTETANGIDDDNNGYIDDIIGYDFADNDADAQANGSQHGTHVGGIAGASTNNSLGIAGVGYDCKVAPLKGFTSIGTVSTGTWEGVMYAADNGYDIVNLSWGNTAGFSQFFQDIINYCVLERDMVVVVAAGNTNADLDFYPASYEHVLSVGASTLSDTKWSSGTYSDHMDIMAPGQSIFSTQNGDTYNSDNGSSHATPQVAGAAGLVKSVFPQYNARQIMEQLRVTTDNIYEIGGNAAFAFKLGKGRLNAFRAVSETTSRSLRVHNFSFDNPFGNHAFYGDTITLSYDLTNYLANLNSPSLGLESASPYVQVLNTTSEPGAFTTMESKAQNAFRIVLDDNTPPETEIDIRFTMTEGSYSDFQNISFFTEPDDFDFGNGNLSLKIVGDGSLAFKNPNYTEGYAMDYNGLPVMKYAGLLIGTDGSNVNDNVTNTFSIPRSRDADFIGQKNIRQLPNSRLPFYGYSEFSSADNTFWIEQSIVPSEEDAYVLIQYRIINTSGSEMVNLEAGFFADYFLGNQTDNHAYWDANLNSLIILDDAQSTFASIGLMETGYHYAALDMQDQNGHTRDIGDSFTDAQKYDLMSGANIAEAGELGSGNDVAGLVNSSFPSVPVNGSVKITVLLAMADAYSELTSTIDAAQESYQAFQKNPAQEEILFTCSGDDFIIDPTNGSSYNFYKDPLGTQYIQTSDQLLMPNVSIDTAVYVSNLDGPFPTEIKRIAIRPISAVADFSLSLDTLYLDNPVVNSVTFTDGSFKPMTWSWDFGNGLQSTSQSPVVNFDQIGIYPIQLSVLSEIGCSDQVTKNLVVANRPMSPVLTAMSFCRNETAQLSHPTDKYVVLDKLGQRQATGSVITLGPFESDSILLIAQKIGGFTSLPQSVLVTVDPLKAGFEIYPDTLLSDTRVLFVFSGENADSFEWRVDATLESTDPSFSIAVSTSEITVELTVQNTTCVDALSVPLTFATSAVPSLTDFLVCNGDDALITPENGTYFGFYADPELTNFLSKGTSHLLENVQASRTIYVVGLDDMLPSAPKAVTIGFEGFETELVADPPILDLEVTNTVQFSPTNAFVTSAEWYVDDLLVETALSPILLFSESGTYEIKLIASNSSGCRFETSSSFVVSTVTGVIVAEDAIIYPNPATNFVHIESIHVIEEIRLFDLSGGVALQDEPFMKAFDLNTKSLPIGIYLLRLNTNKGVIERKISIR